MNEAPQSIIFDLFGTLVDVDWKALPRRLVGGRNRVVTVDGIDELLIEAKAGLTVEVFFDHLDTAGEIIAAWKGGSDCEVSSGHRFRLALERAGVGPRRNGLAIEMSLRHMRTLASVLRFPEARREALVGLSDRYQLGLISNFDHGPTGRALLAMLGIDRLVESALISDEMGLRKPSTLLFAHACGLLGVAPERALYVGDSYDNDVVGATQAGLAAIWIDESDHPSYPALARIADVAQLPKYLDQRFGS